jgi:hypothetical protein
MQKLYIILSLVILIQSCKPEAKTNILFIGNSLTYYNEMPNMLQAMFNEKNIPITINQSTYSGYSLKSHLDLKIIGAENKNVYTRPKHLNETTATEKILLADTIYEHIIIQERTTLAVLDSLNNNETKLSIKSIKELANHNSKIWLFQNFPSNKDYPKQYCTTNNTQKQICTDSIRNLSQEIDKIKIAFKELGENYNVVRIGESFGEVLENRMDINLYADSSHPSKEGSFLIALNFYSCLTNENPIHLNYNASLSIEKSNYLKKIVNEMQNCH